MGLASVLRQHHQGLAAKGLGLVAHLAQATALVGIQVEHAGEFGLQRAQGRVHLGVIGFSQVQRNQVLAHVGVLPFGLGC
jgi:hypothetical protein